VQTLLVLGLVGLFAQLVDGTLGMGYGMTSTTLLVVTGMAPALASATVHFAEVGTTLASGTAHWRFGNVDWRTVGLLALPGALGAFAGAVLLSSVPVAAAAPWTAAILLGLGLFLLRRFARGMPPAPRTDRRLSRRTLVPLGLVAGFLDASGGGGWGPVGTSTLLATGRLEPRKVVGSVNAAEFLVALAASVGFVLGLGWHVVATPAALMLLAGGAVAAPVAAWLVRHVSAHRLGLVAGGMAVLTNTRVLLQSLDARPDVRGASYAAVAALVGLAAATAWRNRRRLALLLDEA
jgi:uncharacterized membrane protein YfcA